MLNALRQICVGAALATGVPVWLLLFDRHRTLAVALFLSYPVWLGLALGLARLQRRRTLLAAGSLPSGGDVVAGQQAQLLRPSTILLKISGAMYLLTIGFWIFVIVGLMTTFPD